MSMNRPTLKDVAAAAGVSFKTVSRVINRDAMVMAETRERVEQAIRDLGYVPDDRARSMRSGSSSFVGFLSDRIATTPYSTDLVRGAQAALAERGMTLMIANIDGDVEAANAAVANFAAQRVAGIIYATMYHRAVEELPSVAIRHVLVNCYAPGRAESAIVPDDYSVGQAAAGHLLSLGHRRIAYITMPAEIDATHLRAEGMRAAYLEAGLDPSRLAIRTGKRRLAGGGEVSMTAQITRDLLSSPQPPTAIIAGNDEEALQVYNAAHRLGVAIPQDLSVVGCDDNQMMALGLDPHLTTVALPYREMGQLAVERLFDPQGPTDLAPQIERIPCPLVVRGSTAPPAR